MCLGNLGQRWDTIAAVLLCYLIISLEFLHNDWVQRLLNQDCWCPLCVHCFGICIQTSNFKMLYYGYVISWSAHNSDHFAKKAQTRYKVLSGMAISVLAWVYFVWFNTGWISSFLGSSSNQASEALNCTCQQCPCILNLKHWTAPVSSVPASWNDIWCRGTFWLRFWAQKEKKDSNSPSA